MDKTLYLSETKGLQVLRDGPSLWITQEGKAGRRIPCRLIGRVVIIGNVRIDSGAVTLFTDSNIPVTFMNMRGEEAAVTVPYTHRHARHYERQKILLKTEENAKRFKNWIASKRREVQIETMKNLSNAITLNFTERGYKDSAYQAAIEEFISIRRDKWTLISAIIANLFRELVIGSIIKADLDPHPGVVNRRHNFGLALDFCHVLQSEADLQGIQFLRSGPINEYIIKEKGQWEVSREGMKDIIHRFENRKKALHERVERLIDDYFALIREVSV